MSAPATETAPAVHGDRDDLLWLAGLLEGEGAFDAHRGIYPRIRLAMCDRDVVGRAASLMDAKIRLSLHRAPERATWHTEISGTRAAEIMRELLPHMGTRRSQRIADVLGAYAFREEGDRGSIPGPSIARPAGVAKPSTAG